MLFNDLQLIEPVLKAVCDQGYKNPTPIQQQAIPHILDGKDILGCAQTGTGKTAAFAIPLIQLLSKNDNKLKPSRGTIKALVLAPTRELAIQVGESFKMYGKYLQLKQLVIFGGVSQYNQVQVLSKGVDILIATPGRLIDLLNQKVLSLSEIKFLVIDEADHMLDMGFIHDVKRIISHLPLKRQTILFSATMSKDIMAISTTFLTDPVKVTVTPPATTVKLIQQSLYHVKRNDKHFLLSSLLADHDIKTALVFTRTKNGADKVAKDITRSGISSAAIHGNKSQNTRQVILKSFKEGKIRVLVATDIAARGIDISGLSHVVNYELPNIPETYVHRVGRTGRAGANGIAISFCDNDEKSCLKEIQKLIDMKIPVIKGHQFDYSNTP